MIRKPWRGALAPAGTAQGEGEQAGPLPEPQRLAEYHIHKAVAEHLAVRAGPDVLWFHVPNGEARSRVTGARLKGLGVRAGVSDFVIIKGGRAHFLELKAGGGRLSPAQTRFLEQARAAGAEAAVTVGLDAALARLEGWGALGSNGGG